MSEEKKISRHIKKALLFAVPVAIGIGLFLFMSSSRKPPGQKEVVANAPLVRVMEIKPITVIPRAIGYGTAEPVRTWKAIAQVSGKIIYSHPQLQKGSIIRQGDELLKIDPTEYQINITKIKASIQNFRVQIQQLNVEEKNNQKLMDLQKTDLEIKRQEAERQELLYKKKIVSKTEYESQLHAFISQEVQVQNIQNALNLVPVKMELLQTQLAQAESDLESANLKLSYTAIAAPFDIQLAAVNNKISEFIQTGQTILEANDISKSEIEAQFVLKSMMPIFMSIKARIGNLEATTKSIGEALGIKAKVSLAGYVNDVAEWKATFTRRSDTLDSETRTAGLIITVDNNFKDLATRKGRLLLKGAYCKVQLEGLAQPNSIVIPRNALHPQNIVYLMDSNRKLVKKKVDIFYNLSDFVVIRDGLKNGDTLILSDIIPAVEGMIVDPTEDTDLFNKLVIDAKGEKI